MVCPCLIPSQSHGVHLVRLVGLVQQPEADGRDAWITRGRRLVSAAALAWFTRTCGEDER